MAFLFVDEFAFRHPGNPQLTTLIEALLTQEERLHLLTMRPDWYRQKLPETVEIYAPPERPDVSLLSRIIPGDRDAAAYAAALGDVYSELKPRAVVFHGYNERMRPLLTYCKKHRITFLVYVRQTRKFEIKDGRLLVDAKKILVPNNLVTQVLKLRCPEVPEDRYMPLPTIVDARRMTTGDKESIRMVIGSSGGARVILSPLEGAADQRHETAIRVLKIVRKQVPEAELWFANLQDYGSGIMDEGAVTKLREFAQNKRVSSAVFFVGKEQRRADLFAGADLYLAPASGSAPADTLKDRLMDTESLPLLLAMATGLPAVVAEGTIAEELLLATGAGAVIPGSDHEEMARATIKYFQHEQLYKTASKEATKRIIKVHSPEAVASLLLAILEDCCAAAG